MAGRLTGDAVAVVFVGSADGRTRSLVEQALTDAGAGAPVRVRALKVPIDPKALRAPLARRHLAAYAAERRLPDLGRKLAAELIDGGETPFWNALSDVLVEERSGDDQAPVDGVVIVRTVRPQAGPTARFLSGFYGGLATAGVSAVGAETTHEQISAVTAFAKADLSTVDDLDTEAGRLSIVLLLAGARPGDYGVKRTAHDGVLPPIEPVAAVPPVRGG